MKKALYFIPERPDGWYEKRTPNGEYRYIGSYASVSFLKYKLKRLK